MIRKALALLLVLSIALLANTGCSSDDGSSDSDFTFAIITDVHADAAHAAALSQLVSRLNEESPDFVVNLGDLIFEGNTATSAQAQEWFDVYQNAMSGLDSSIPIYHAVGCHDVVGIGSDNLQNTDFGYGKDLFLSEGWGKEGLTYYSFDHEGYHCIVLDPNDLVSGEQVYQIPQAQLQWLEEDLAAAGEDAPLLVFFSEPTVTWAGRSAFTRLLKGRSATFFSGHLHHDIAMTFTDFPEQVTASASGEWWQGVNPDGRPAGYRLVTVKGDDIDSLYKGTADERTIDPNMETIVSGKVDLAVKIDSQNGDISSASYRVDDGEPVSMALEKGSEWTVATASWDTGATTEGYHQITFKAGDGSGSFEKPKQVKVSATQTVTVSELNAHLTTYQGSYVSIEGTADLVYLGPLSISGFYIPDGMGFVFMTDESEGVIVLPAENLYPGLSIVKSQFANGDRVIIKAVPLRMSMAYVTSTQEWAAYYERIRNYISYLPLTAREPRDVTQLADLKAVWGARWISANDLTFLSA
jgi:3',5'-cyclic-AMP phosphodiesterase